MHIRAQGNYLAWKFERRIVNYWTNIDNRFSLKEKHLYRSSKYIFNCLKPASFDSSWLFSFKDFPLYRRVPKAGKGSDPLSIAGALACGGRCNIGSSQMTQDSKKDFGRLGTMMGAVYLATDPSTARREYGDWGVTKSTAVTHRLTLKTRKRLRLIDANFAMDDLANSYLPAIKAMQEGGVLGASYCDVKRVAPTMIFNHWLWHSCQKPADGIIFDSYANPGKGRNICLFLDDDRMAKKLLKRTGKTKLQ